VEETTVTLERKKQIFDEGVRRLEGFFELSKRQKRVKVLAETLVAVHESEDLAFWHDNGFAPPKNWRSKHVESLLAQLQEVA
jgi:hypothetical protein